MYDLTASIVLYKSEENEIKKTIESFFNTTLNVGLYLIDNSPTDALRNIYEDPRITYIFNNANIGYGAAHNIALKKEIQKNTHYHIVLNPDIKLNKNTLEVLLEFMKANKDVGLVMPKVLNPDGKIQRLCKLLPTPFDLMGRRFFTNNQWAKKRNSQYELQDFDYSYILNTPCLSGCFMFIRISILQKAGLFDPMFFMYLEDYDLSRRIHQYSKTVMNPQATVIHAFQKGSYKNIRLLGIHFMSAIRYFNKWGWFSDKVRKKINDRILQEVQQKH